MCLVYQNKYNKYKNYIPLKNDLAINPHGLAKSFPFKGWFEKVLYFEVSLLKIW